MRNTIRPSSVVDPWNGLYRERAEHIVAGNEMPTYIRHCEQIGIKIEAPADPEPRPNTIFTFVDGLARSKVALLGGALLLVSMLVVSLKNSQNSLERRRQDFVCAERADGSVLLGCFLGRS